MFYHNLYEEIHHFFQTFKWHICILILYLLLNDQSFLPVERGVGFEAHAMLPTRLDRVEWLVRLTYRVDIGWQQWFVKILRLDVRRLMRVLSWRNWCYGFYWSNRDELCWYGGERIVKELFVTMFWSIECNKKINGQ